LQPGLIFVQPRTGFQVASVHSIDDWLLMRFLPEVEKEYFTFASLEKED
jgi:hypothetical protein